VTKEGVDFVEIVSQLRCIEPEKKISVIFNLTIGARKCSVYSLYIDRPSSEIVIIDKASAQAIPV
jgi:hypothetical protein